MTPEEIKNGDSIISTFMGDTNWHCFNKLSGRNDELIVTFKTKQECDDVIRSSFPVSWVNKESREIPVLYHKDWNHLNRAIHKCWEATTEEEREFKGLTLFELGLFSSIEDVWEATVECIEWINKKSSQ